MTIIHELNFEYAGDQGEELRDKVSEMSSASNNLYQLQSLYESIIEDVDSLWSSDLLYDEEFTSRDFELLIDALWDWKGYQTFLTPPTNDGGVDIIAQKDGIGVFIEAKKTGLGNRIGVREVRNLYAAASNPRSLSYEIMGEVERISEIIIVTTSDLSTQAINFLESVSNNGNYRVTIMRMVDIIYELNKSKLTPNGWRDF